MKRLLVLAALILLLAGCTGQSPEDRTSNAQNPLRGLGYSSGYHQQRGPVGILKHDTEAWESLTLYTSAHRAEARLMDLAGDVVHRWHLPVAEAFPQHSLGQKDWSTVDFRYWRKVYPYPNGNLLAIHSPFGIVKMDSTSRRLWSRQDANHHDMDVGPSGRIYALTKKKSDTSVFGDSRTRLVDTLTVYSDTGARLAQYDLLAMVLNSRYRGVRTFFDPSEPDILHTNSVDVLKKGHLLLSMKRINAILEVNLTRREITWMVVGITEGQHDAQYIGDGKITVFDNRNPTIGSRAIQMKLRTHRIGWSWEGHSDTFYSGCCGTVQRLPNGNTLVNHTQAGKVWEVTPEGRVVWAWKNPHTNRKGQTAVTFEARRYARDYFTFLN